MGVFNGHNGSILKSWAKQDAVNFQDMARKLAAELESSDIAPFYAEYMDIERTPETGLAMEDVGLLYEHRAAASRAGRIAKNVT